MTNHAAIPFLVGCGLLLAVGAGAWLEVDVRLRWWLRGRG